MTEQDPISFNLTLEEIDVELVQKNGTKRKCYLKEMDGFHRDIYINRESSKMNNAKKSLNDFKDVQAGLLADVLYDRETDEKIPIKEIREFPAKVQSALHDIAAKLNGFDKKPEESELDAKNY